MATCEDAAEGLRRLLTGLLETEGGMVEVTVTIRTPRSPLPDAPPLLAVLAQGDELPVIELARRASITVPTASRRLRKHERKGFVEARTDPDDKRSVLFKITNRGLDSILGRKETGAATDDVEGV